MPLADVGGARACAAESSADHTISFLKHTHPTTTARLGRVCTTRARCRGAAGDATAMCAECGAR